MSHTFATMTVKPRTYDEVTKLLEAAGYHQAFDRSEEPPLLDMHGLALHRGHEEQVMGSGPTKFDATSPHGNFTVQTALKRAAFHLRKQGYGAEDARMADVLESLVLTKVSP